jgi:hypothetical protein
MALGRHAEHCKAHAVRAEGTHKGVLLAANLEQHASTVQTP